MKKWLIFSLYFLSPALLAQAATYDDGVLTVPEVAVIDELNPVFFSDVKLRLEEGGGFSLLAANDANLAYVDSVEIAIMESFPVQVSVTVNGNESVPCVKLLGPAIARKDDVFRVLIGESVLGPAESCIAVLDPFETTFSLDVLGLPAGTYTVDVNGVQNQFTLYMDNG